MPKLMTTEKWINLYCEHPISRTCDGCIHLNKNDGNCMSWVHYRDHNDLSLSTRYNKSTQCVYKIMRISDGMFKDKGFSGNFSKDGHVFEKLAYARNHVAQDRTGCIGCVIVEYELKDNKHIVIKPPTPNFGFA